MTYAAITNKEQPSFYVAKSWHNRFAGTRGCNISAANKQFKVKIKMPRRELPDTGIYVDGKPDIIEAVRKHFESILRFKIGTTPLAIGKCKIVPLEIVKLTDSPQQYVSMVQMYGVAVAFPRKGSDGLTMIQGRQGDIKRILSEFGKILQRQIELETDVSEEKSDKKQQKIAVSNRRFHKTLSRLNMEINEVLFFHPREDDDHDFERFLEVLSSADDTIDICVFTITDNRIRYCLADEARQGVKIRIITDNSQAEALGSDAKWLNEQAHIPVKVDFDPNEESHMHHKYCVIDNKIVMNGSFNWTRSAAGKNYENITITTNKQLVKQFKDYFHGMWNNDKSIVDISVYQYQTKH
eukprot:87167_1